MITFEMEGGTATVTFVSLDEKKPGFQREISNETLCSDSSNGVRSKCKSAGNFLRKRRALQPLLGTNSPYHSTNSMSRLIPLHPKGSVSATTQKIMSARMLRVKQLQNELSDAQLQLGELAAENRALRTLQKRQEVLLKRYESKQAVLPQIIHSYEEEVRTLSSRLKQARAQIRTLEERLRTRDNELSSLKDKCHHLEQLTQSKHLRQREQLQHRLEILQDQLHDKEKTVQLLTRKVMLEGKNYKHQLAVETTRHKAARNELASALERISELELQLKKKDKYLASSMPRPVSLLSLQTPSRISGFQTQSRTEIVAVSHLDNALEEEEDDDDDDENIDQRPEDDPDQEDTYSYTEPHTSTSQMSSLETMKELGQNNPSNVSMSMDYQAKRFQFSNRHRKNANAVQETTESASGHSKTVSLDESNLDSKKEVPTQTESDRALESKIESRRSSGKNSNGSLNNSEDEKKDKKIDLFSSLVLELDRELNDHSIKVEETVSQGLKQDLKPSKSSKLLKTEEAEIRVKQSKSDGVTHIASRKNSLAVDNSKEEKNDDRRHSIENVPKDSIPTGDSLFSHGVSESWEELDKKIKSNSDRVKAEVERQLFTASTTTRSFCKPVEESKKKALLEAIKIMGDDAESQMNKPGSTVTSSVFVGSVRDSSVHSKPFTSQQHPKRKSKLLDDLFPNSPPDLLVDPVSDGVEPTGFKRN